MASSVPNNNKFDRIVLDGAALAQMLRGSNGMVWNEMLRRGQLVQDAARRQIRLGHVHGGDGRPNLRDTLIKRVVKQPNGDVSVMIGSDSPIAMIHHEGTRPHQILPVKSRFLVFPGKGGGVVFATKVNHPGTHANRYLVDNLPLAIKG